MPQEVKRIGFKELDKLIEQHKEDKYKKKSLLILKSQGTPYREKGIPKRVAVKVVNSAITQAEFLANGFSEEDNEEMFEFQFGMAAGLKSVIQLCFPED